MKVAFVILSSIFFGIFQFSPLAFGESGDSTYQGNLGKNSVEECQDEDCKESFRKSSKRKKPSLISDEFRDSISHDTSSLDREITGIGDRNPRELDRPQPARTSEQ